ncbi:MAG: tRNA (N6-threonylcarbamoyladenosine(37)-N6)-methyltransferase TrmO [Thaumarchaeota archaeon]|nr:tRNA (N6-threonylcarbamoyladenosine(37)-N6)-methyltransferase TrmO [Nitrososphaerota archaeon]
MALSGQGEFSLMPVGVVRTKSSDEEVRGWDHSYESIVEILPEFEGALDGLDGYSHLFVLCFLNRVSPEDRTTLKVRPRRLLRKGFKLEDLPLKGVFALDSPVRPNPIGLSLVKLVRREGRMLVVEGLDYFDGTPVLDVKPYQPEHRVEEVSVPEWYQDLRDRAGRI